MLAEITEWGIPRSFTKLKNHIVANIVTSCEISSSHGGEYDVQSCLLGYTALMKEAVRTSETALTSILHGSITQKTTLNIVTSCLHFLTYSLFISLSPYLSLFFLIPCAFATGSFLLLSLSSLLFNLLSLLFVSYFRCVLLGPSHAVNVLSAPLDATSMLSNGATRSGSCTDLYASQCGYI
jgi:hypothetical protein